jgi:branched-chain amino acid transport system ATP-binding protein
VRARALDALDTFGVLARAHDPVSDLSFAAARCVELACVLVERPRLMLLDEPTTGLDNHEIDELLSVLRRVRGEGTTILVVAHDVRFVMTICDHTYVLSEGHVLAEGAPSAIQTNPAVIEAYLGKSA